MNIKVTQDRLVQDEDGSYTLDLTNSDLPEGTTFIQTKEITRRIDAAKRTAREALKQDEDFVSELLEGRAGQDGAGTSTAWRDRHLVPVQRERDAMKARLEAAEARLAALSGDAEREALTKAAREAGIREDVTAEDIRAMFGGRLAYDAEARGWYVKGQEDGTYELGANGAPKDARELIEGTRDVKPYLFQPQQNPTTGSVPLRSGGVTSDKSDTRPDFRKVAASLR